MSGALLVATLSCGDDVPPAAGSTSGGGTTGTTGTTTAAPPLDSSTTGDHGTSETTSAPDALPPAPTLDTPVDGATAVAIETSLCWNLVEDPEGEPLRYRVFVDDIELTEGLAGEEGHEGPCVGPLTFVHERSYAWRVEAFEVDDPTRSSEPSDTWTFDTVPDGLTTTVFEEDFEGGDEGWGLDGDASDGHWIFGNPVPVDHLGERAQPGVCANGQGCAFTGQNPVGQPDDADVTGGSTVLYSPTFDLRGAAAATVELQRFFYKSELEPGPALTVELLVPRDRPLEYDAYPLLQLGDPTAVAPANLWRPLELVACGVPMVAGSRLRITATDDGPGILEAAIDSVRVRAHDDATVCGSGEGGRCEPEAGEAACPAELLCCPQGTINRGVHRCTPPVAAIDPDSPPPTPDAPNNGPLGCDAPDLTIDESWIEPVFTDIFVSEATCEYAEGCVGGLGWRTIMRFSLATPNIGSRDMVLGVPANEPDLFHYSDCHSHYHFDEFARYELRDGGGVVATGHKQAFCLLDTYSWAWNNEPGTYDCSNQGIGRGFADVYESDLPCQWVDVTEVSPGDYTLRMELNTPRPDAAEPLLIERDYANGVLEVPVTVPER